MQEIADMIVLGLISLMWCSAVMLSLLSVASLWSYGTLPLDESYTSLKRDEDEEMVTMRWIGTWILIAVAGIAVLLFVCTILYGFGMLVDTFIV